MNSVSVKYINRSQDDYLDLLLQYEEQVQANGLSVHTISSILDEVKCFWLKRLRLMEFELEELVEKQTCYFLASAIYLDVTSYDHYYFKSLGDFHFIPDPFSKLEMIFRIPEEDLNIAYMSDYFRRAYSNTIDVLTKYKGCFYVLPLQEIAIDDFQEHQDFLDMFIWKFISDAFNFEFKSFEDFHNKYSTFEELEAELNSYVRENIVFNQLSDRKLPLKERVEKFISQYKNISSMDVIKSDVQMFLLAVFSSIGQLSDIIYVSSVLNMSPFIVSEITFNYLTLIMSVIIDDKYLGNIFEKTVLSYLFYRTVDEGPFENINFIDYCERLERNSLLNALLEKIHQQEIDIFKEKTSEVISIIEDVTDTLFH